MQYRPYDYNYQPTNQNDEYNPYLHSHPQYPNYPYPEQNGPPPQQQTPYEQFAKPLQPVPMNWGNPMQQNADFTQSNANLPPQQSPYPNNGIKGYFQDEDGQVDFDKMLSTVGQLANTYHQVSPIVKQFGSIIKSFR